MVSIDVERADILEYDADVLLLKYAQDLHGVDGEVATRLDESYSELRRSLPSVGDCALIPSNGSVEAHELLFVGVEPLGRFGYTEIREFGRRALEHLERKSPNARHICLTLHGANYGLDEIEAFESEVAGLIDGIESGRYPRGLQQITVVERNHRRAQQLEHTLSELLPDGVIEADSDPVSTTESSEVSTRLESVGSASEDKPHVFVAMPFSDEMDDVYHYGIQGAVKSAGFLCERADSTAFTGDILDRIQERIESSTLVVADLSNSNPNVYLEVGYAWGCDVPTVLLTDNTDDLEFDVQSHNCVIYDNIRNLEEELEAFLKDIRPRIE